MATHLKNLSDYDATGISAEGMRFSIVVSDWNTRVTGALLDGAVQALRELGCKDTDLQIHRVPGSYELPTGAKWAAETNKPDAVICLGCVIQGETRHFDFICQAVAQGLMDLNLSFGIPFIFGVLTPENMDQALDRSGGKHGNKGIEAAVSAVKMCLLRTKLR
ncbi:MAG: 6,7-dimethyl-8-ribityllumazine synthase [Bacteroidota bacterium]